MPYPSRPYTSQYSLLYPALAIALSINGYAVAVPDDLVDVSEQVVDPSASADDLLAEAKQCRQEFGQAARRRGQLPEVAAKGAACLEAALAKLKSDDSRLPRVHQDLAELLAEVGNYNQANASIR